MSGPFEEFLEKSLREYGRELRHRRLPESVVKQNLDCAADFAAFLLGTRRDS
jgi:hypothetical protein